jgi:hypothetical protein
MTIIAIGALAFSCFIFLLAASAMKASAQSHSTRWMVFLTDAIFTLGSACCAITSLHSLLALWL